MEAVYWVYRFRHNGGLSHPPQIGLFDAICAISLQRRVVGKSFSYSLHF